jgi:hypothetical protein
MFYVYLYVDPRTTKPFYVGKGSGDRDKYHIWNVSTHPNYDLRLTIQQLASVGQRPIIDRVFETTDEKAAFLEEKRLIDYHGRLDLGTGILCNRTPGGEGFGNTGTKWTNTQRIKIKQKYVERSPGVATVRHTLDGKEDKHYCNSRELREDGYSTTQMMAIRRCCKGERYSVNGHRWRYANQSLQQASTLMKSVVQMTKQGKLVTTYLSVAQASKLTGINQGDIASVARGNTQMKSAGGFIWKYVQ